MFTARLIIFCFFCSIASCARKRIANVHKFESVDCESRNESIVLVDQCKLKANGSLDMSFDFIQKVDEIYVSIISFIKNGKAFRRQFKSPAFEYCGFRSGISSNFLIKTLFDQVTAGVNIFPECPFIGKIGVENIDFRDDKFFAVDQTGVYQSNVLVSNARLDLLNIKIVTATTSMPDKKD